MKFWNNQPFSNFPKVLLIFSILVLAFILRFYQLGQNPPSLDWDETAHGYNAYSILKTGRDEYGYKLPLYFRSFDDYKPPVYTYLVVPSIAIFGVKDFSVRFPSAFLGTLTILFTYLMVKELFQNKKIALFSAFFLAISPWHLQFSRVAFETNSAIFFSVIGTWAFLKGILALGKKITLWMSLAALSFGINLYVYHNARVFIPLFSLVLIFLFRRKLISKLKFILIPAIIALIFSIFLIPIVTSISGQLRYKGTSIFGDVSPLYKSSEQILQDQNQGQALIGKILHNRRFIYIPILTSNYLSHLNPDFLFFDADMDRHHAPLIGLLYLWDLPFLILGIYYLVNKKFEKKSRIIVFAWFLLAPVAAAVTWGVPHALRSEIYLPTFQIFTTIGIYYFLKRHPKIIFSISVFLLLISNFTFYLHQYYIHMPYEFSKAWLYGRREAALFTDSVKDNYDKVIISTKLEQPHEFWLYYLKYDPARYQKGGGTVSGGFLETRNHFDKFYFKPIDFQNMGKQEKTLLVGSPEEFPSNVKTLKQIFYLNGEPAIYIVDGNEN